VDISVLDPDDQSRAARSARIDAVDSQVFNRRGQLGKAWFMGWRFHDDAGSCKEGGIVDQP
jgi:hypothetical protein